MVSRKLLWLMKYQERQSSGCGLVLVQTLLAAAPVEQGLALSPSSAAFVTVTVTAPCAGAAAGMVVAQEGLPAVGNGQSTWTGEAPGKDNQAELKTWD